LHRASYSTSFLTKRHRENVKLFVEQPPTRLQRLDQPSQHSVPLRQMHEHEPGVNQVERALRQGVGNNVVPANLKIRTLERVEKACVDVGDDHTAGRADALAQPGGDRATSASEFQAMPATGDSALLDVVDGPGIEQLTQSGEPVARLHGGVVKCVAAGVRCRRRVDKLFCKHK